MSKQPTTLQCYLIPCLPLPLLLPFECVAEIVEGPEIEALEKGAAPWMIGHTDWQSQRIPVMSYSALQNAEFDPENRTDQFLVVLKPVPSAARKAFSGLICDGRINQIEVDQNVAMEKASVSVDNRYVEAVVSIAGEQYVIPKLSAISVAFSYF